MIENFGGILNLVIWSIVMIGSGYYSYRCLFGTQGMIEQYGVGDGAAYPLYLVGTFAGAGFIMSGVVLLAGPHGAWAFVTYSFVQSLLGTIFGYRILNSSWSRADGVKMTAEFWIAPLVFAVFFGFLLYNMQDILYASQ